MVSFEKKRYELAKKDFISTMKDLAIKISEFDSNIDPDSSIYMFRINRDIRFSKDKSPYKTNFGCFITSNGKKSGAAGYYVHIQPNDNFIGGGYHMPEKSELDTIRKYIINHEDEFRDIIYSEVVRDEFDGFDSNEQLKTVPRGFDKESSAAELLKYKSFTVGAKTTQKMVLSKDFEKYAITKFRAMYPLVQFLNNALKS